VLFLISCSGSGVGRLGTGLERLSKQRVLLDRGRVKTWRNRKGADEGKITSGMNWTDI
jgi:hypothetical protein